MRNNEIQIQIWMVNRIKSKNTWSKNTNKHLQEFGLAKYLCSYFPSDFLHAVKSYNVGLPSLLHLRGKAYRGFLLPFNFGFNGKHAKHYTNEAT
jgi:hypothetical protein